MTNRNLDGSSREFPQDKDIQFISDGHKYIHTPTGTELTPVSTVCSRYFKQFDTEKWAAIKAQEHGIEPEDMADLWKCNGDCASFAGTHMHAQIERYFNGESDLNPVCTFTHNSLYRHVVKKIDISKELGLFHEFVSKYSHIKPFRTEWCVYDLGLKMAGTIDLVCRTGENEVELFDWKRSNKIIDRFSNQVIDQSKFGNHAIRGLESIPDTSYWHYALQQNLYRYILENNYGLKVTAMHLVVLHPDYPRYYVVKVSDTTPAIKTIVNDLKLSI